ncbi:MAG: glycosyltransferase family 2 protein [Planctomycetota bacterium]|jgi:glycosyltransferase involved in cell wall biosynthesis
MSQALLGSPPSTPALGEVAETPTRRRAAPVPPTRKPLPFDGVTVIVPCYNEQRCIERTARQIHDVLDATGWPFQLVFVDDGSTDETAAELERTRRHCDLQILRNEVNRGYGAALKRALKTARFDAIVITDADGTYPNERIPDLIERLRDNDMVVGARVGARARIPLVRRPAKWVLRKLAGYLTERRIPDLNSGLRVMKRSIVRRFVRLLPDGFSFTTTITLAMLTHGYRVHYEPIDYHQRIGKSSIRPLRDTVGFFSLIVRTVMYFKPLKIFAPASALLFLAAVTVALLTKLLTGVLADVTAVTMAMASIQLMGIGLLADLVGKRWDLSNGEE